MIVLVLNCGSSSVKFQLIETDAARIEADSDRCLAKGIVERLGSLSLLHFQAAGREPVLAEEPLRDARAALDRIMRWATSPEAGIEGVRSVADVQAVGHRVVHGGEKFSASVRIDAARRLVPNASPVSGIAPPIASGDPSVIQLARNAFSSDPVIRADALRRLGRTNTVGDPARYAGAAFTQQDESSCNVAAQAQVLQVHGLLPAGQTAASQEQALIDEAKERGFMKTGTPPEYTGSLLSERGLLVVKGHGSNQTALTEAVKRGSVVQLGVDANVFWSTGKRTPAPHSVLVTGAEISKSDGSILGVYVNDSGTTPPGAGKFVPWSKMLKSWRGNYAEIR